MYCLKELVLVHGYTKNDCSKTKWRNYHLLRQNCFFQASICKFFLGERDNPQTPLLSLSSAPSYVAFGVSVADGKDCFDLAPPSNHKLKRRPLNHSTQDRSLKVGVKYNMNL